MASGHHIHAVGREHMQAESAVRTQIFAIKRRCRKGPGIVAIFLTASVQTELLCHDMRKKVIPFPPRKAAHSRPVPQRHSQITVQVGRQRYTLNVPCPSVGASPEPTPAPTPTQLDTLQVQTRFLRLGQPAGLGDRIDGWRVCWVGGWDKSKMLFVGMVERVVKASQM